MKKRLIIIAGPTASGKTSVSIELAKKIKGEIISADSIQVYKKMDIGSAKVTEAEMQGITHYLVDVLDPTQGFSVHEFQRMAKESMSDIWNHKNQPIIVGGTGFYIQAVTRDIDFSISDHELSIRSEVEDFYQKNGENALYQWLLEVDPQYGEITHKNNIKRVKRALEYYGLTGEKLSEHNASQKEKESPYDVQFFVLNMERKRLYERIDKRVELMIEAGLVEEVKALLDQGYSRDLTSMQGLGYKEIVDYLDGKISLEEAIYIIKRDTRHFAKRQLTWFRREKDVHWIKVDDFNFNVKEIVNEILTILNY